MRHITQNHKIYIKFMLTNDHIILYIKKLDKNKHYKIVYSNYLYIYLSEVKIYSDCFL